MAKQSRDQALFPYSLHPAMMRARGPPLARQGPGTGAPKRSLLPVAGGLAALSLAALAGDAFLGQDHFDLRRLAGGGSSTPGEVAKATKPVGAAGQRVMAPDPAAKAAEEVSPLPESSNWAMSTGQKQRLLLRQQLLPKSRKRHEDKI
ncbi:hypothetical protein AK812_SmicGene38001 [Symbiodinium microadriaticum]|uniref:Uncharacterized protein n=1 Tax=Symbiodinium microadriaticum TaxID=2951 RepID=A0A1Q9CEV8_SYMMI|nr:hypothetical protein AK812_SmicGene38001 [Symbiodinium microadriaticum]